MIEIMSVINVRNFEQNAHAVWGLYVCEKERRRRKRMDDFQRSLTCCNVKSIESVLNKQDAPNCFTTLQHFLGTREGISCEKGAEEKLAATAQQVAPVSIFCATFSCVW
jgi:hypothetical protein